LFCSAYFFLLDLGFHLTPVLDNQSSMGSLLVEVGAPRLVRYYNVKKHDVLIPYVDLSTSAMATVLAKEVYRIRLQ